MLVSNCRCWKIRVNNGCVFRSKPILSRALFLSNWWKLSGGLIRCSRPLCVMCSWICIVCKYGVKPKTVCFLAHSSLCQCATEQELISSLLLCIFMVSLVVFVNEVLMNLSSLKTLPLLLKTFWPHLNAVFRTLSNWVYELDKWAPSVVKIAYKVRQISVF